jgi:hypothetical protein
MGLRERWLARVDELGLGPAQDGGAFDHFLGVEVWRPPSSCETDQLLDHLAAPHGLTAIHPAFARRDAARLALRIGLPSEHGKREMPKLRHVPPR